MEYSQVIFSSSLEIESVPPSNPNFESSDICTEKTLYSHQLALLN